jgi:NAD+ kinase
MKFSLVINTHRAEALKAAQGLITWLKQKSVDYILDIDAAKLLRDPNRAKIENLHQLSDVIVSLGGDGTLLKASHYANSKPILGINLGRLGFLAEFSVEEMYTAIDKVLNKKFHTETRTQLDAIVKIGKHQKVFTALNDVIVERGGYPRMPNIDLRIDGRLLADYKADGIIIATSTGSTAYSMSAGGPIIVPKSKVFVITPICPHMLTVRPIIISDSKEVEISVASYNGNFVLNCDGSFQHRLSSRHHIRIRKSPQKVLLIVNENRNYYDVLRTKLLWGKDHDK